MAVKRMFSKNVVDTDRFLEMPVSAQALYFHLGMHGDDDGFVSSPQKITRAVGCNADDLRILAAKKFIIPFDSGVVVIVDWKVNNTLKSDRYSKTVCQEEMAYLSEDKTGRYMLDSDMVPTCFQTGNTLEPQYSEVKGSIAKKREAEPLCAEPDKSASAPPVICLPLNDGTEHPVFDNQVEEWKNLYPGVNVEQELRSMKGWLLANPTKRKTKRGIARFINSWLSREQDRGGGKANGNSKPQNSRSSYTPGSWDDFPY